ncbi:MAG: hypothetical protein DSY80_11225, partial [Desulfocapsa sp.]
MSEKDTKQKLQTLGEFLKESRKAANLSLAEAQNSTKITLTILKAIEKDDFSSMPAEAFCRGFYVMYAKFLNLDHQNVLSRYLEARNLPPVASSLQATPPVRKSGQFSNYAEPSSISPLMSSIFALAILLIVLIGGCWYFNWNPISYLNSKLDAAGGQEQQETTVGLSSEPVIKSEDSISLSAETVPAPYHLDILFHTNGILTVTLDNG